MPQKDCCYYCEFDDAHLICQKCLMDICSKCLSQHELTYCDKCYSIFSEKQFDESEYKGLCSPSQKKKKKIIINTHFFNRKI